MWRAGIDVPASEIKRLMKTEGLVVRGSAVRLNRDDEED